MGTSVDRAMVVLLGDHDRAELTELVDADPVVNAAVSSRLRALSSLAPRDFGGSLYGVRGASGRLRAAMFSGGTVLPVGGEADDWRSLGERLAARSRTCSSIVGQQAAVHALWQVLEPQWGPAREHRDVQLLLELPADVLLPPAHPGLRLARPAQLEPYTEAAAAMFAEELGIVPPGGRAGYRARVLSMIRAERCLAVFDRSGAVVFKADIGAVSPHTCQVQGVWVRPDLRGRGLGTAALAGVLAHTRSLAPTASLYVNDFNVTARRMYERLGMRHVATLSSVLF